MIICKYRAIFLFLLLIIHLDDAGATNTNTKRKAKCAKPKEVQHAVLREKYANKEKFEEGDKVEYDCELGYTIEGITRERWCRNTKWTEVRFTCNQITCSWVPHPDNGRHLVSTYAVGDVMKFECNIGYKLKGRDAILCRIDGQWSPPQGPTCDPILCPTLPQIQHGSIFQDTSDGLANNYESVAEYTCDRDYYLNGNTQLRTVKRTCQSDGKWSGKEPICEVPKCNLIEDFFGGNVNYFGGRDLYSQAFYSCDENYSLKPINVGHSTCENNLRWEPPPPKCYKKSDRYIPNNGYLRGQKRGRVLHDESYMICCKKGFEVERDGVLPVNKESCTNIRNNNGTLEPRVKCVEGRCVFEPSNVQGLCFVTDDERNCKRKEFKIHSGSSAKIKCEKGYTLFVSGKEVTDQGKITCERGSYPEFLCTANDCTAPEVNNTKPLSKIVLKHKEKVTYQCKKGYWFSKSKLEKQESICNFGNWTTLIPEACEPVPKCNLIEDFYGGNVNFLGGRDLYSQAIYSCDENYSMIPSNVRHSTCENNLRWDPPPPKCFKKADRYVPNDGYLRGRKTGKVSHDESYKICCKQGFEVERDGVVPVNKKSCTNIRNNNGTLEPRVKCVEGRCVFNPSKVQGACFVTDDERNCKSDKFKIHSESSMKIKCVKGYTLFVSGKEVKDQGKITCVKGSYPDFNCTANDCTAPEVNNTEPLSKIVFKHDEKVTYKCKEGYWFSKSKLEKQVLLTSESKCSLGNWTAHIPDSCEPVACFLNVHVGTEYNIYGKNKVIVKASYQDNGTSIGVRCKDGFDLYDDADTLINDTNVVPKVTCHVGEWSNIHWCKKRCNIPNRVNIQFSKDGENLTINDTIKHMESVNIICTGEQRNSSSFIKCVNGILNPYDDCTSENDSKLHISTSTLSTASTKNVNNQQINENEAPDDNDMEDQSDHHNNKSKGCKLSTDRRYMYSNFVGLEKMPGDHIDFGETLKVKCRFIDMYTFMTYDYDYYNDNDTTADNITMYDDITNSDDITIVCKDDHTMTKITKECPDATKDKSCLQIDNGNVRISNSFYVVSCDKGFSLDIFEPEEKRSMCIDGKLKSVIGGQEPKCIPDRCKVPYDYDTLLSISDRFRVSLSGGSVVEVGDFVYFNCSKAGDDMHEPVNRKFKCINGQWMEDERNTSWKFGNNGDFPKCRKTKCKPECQNGGVCLRDDQCKCKHLTTGKRCEIVSCDDKCFENNGTCVGPGKCKCPKGKVGTHCEKSSCILPENKNMASLITPGTYFGIGETVRNFQCQLGHFPSSDRGMTCRSDGSWSDIVTCEKGKMYLISTKTGTRRFAGTDANVYITLFGPKGRTRRIKFWGDFESDDVDEIRTFARDVRPIHSVQIGHDGDNILSDWDLEYVSIYVENMEEFYVFRNIKQQWVKDGNDLTLDREGNQACINTFSDKYLWFPKWNIINSFYLGEGLGMSSRACKQACINWNKNVCNGVYRNTIHHSCLGFSETRDGYFTVHNEPWYGELFFRTCKKFN